MFGEREGIMLEREFQASRIMKALGNLVRFMIVKELLKEPLTPELKI